MGTSSRFATAAAWLGAGVAMVAACGPVGSTSGSDGDSDAAGGAGAATGSGSQSGSGTGSSSGDVAGSGSSGASSGTASTGASSGTVSSGSASSGAASTGASSGTSSGARDGGIPDASSGAHDAGMNKPETGPPQPPATCSWTGALSYSGNASFTCYYFGQGTSRDPQTGRYKTACGYLGDEPTGGSGNNCGQAASDRIDNIASTGGAASDYFAAIPGDSGGGFSNVVHCGECARLTNPSNHNSVIVTIIDECPVDGPNNPPCRAAGHLDVSMQAFNALGFGQGDPSGTTWKSVPCPVTGNIKATLNAGQSSQVYFQNTVYPIKAVSAAQQSQYGYWDFYAGGGAGGPAQLTDVEGHTLTINIPAGGGDVGAQFPSPGSCQ